MAYLIRRKAVYYLNFKLPKHLFPKCHTLRLSLNIRHRQSALFLAASIVQRLHGHLSEQPLTDLQTLRALCSQWRNSAPIPTISISPRATSTAPVQAGHDTPTLAALSKLYIEEGKRGGTWRQVSADEVERALSDLFELMGDMPALAFDGYQAPLLKERLSRCPQYFGLRSEFRGKTLKKVVESGCTYCPVVVHRIDRLTRDHAHFVTLQKKYTFIEAEDVHSSGLLRNIKSLLAEEELMKIRSRTKAGLAELEKLAASGDAEAQEKIARRDASRAKAWAVGNGAAVRAKQVNADSRADAIAHHIKACLYDGCISLFQLSLSVSTQRV